ncbi:MAG: hypothetical protein AAGH87_06655 [Pseudomonadota bacterium]
MKSEPPYAAGDVVSVRFAGVLRHYGVVTFGGRILSNNGMRGGVISQSLEDFADGRPVRWHGAGGNASDYLSHDRAQRHLGRQYTLTGQNCIDYTRNVRGQRPTPWQLLRAGAMAIGDMGRRR